MPIQLAPNPSFSRPIVIPQGDPVSDAANIVTQQGNLYNQFTDMQIRRKQRAQEVDDIATRRVENEQRRSQSAWQQKLLQNLQASLPAGATELDIALVKAYIQDYGVPPKGADGKIDLGAVQKRLEEASKRREAAELAKARAANRFTEIEHEEGFAPDGFLPRKRTRIYEYGPDGKPVFVGATGWSVDFDRLNKKEALEARKEAAGTSATGGKTAAQIKADAAAGEQNIHDQAALRRIEQARKILNDPELNAVGPLTGTPVAEFFRRGLSALGASGPQKTLDAQSKLRFLISEMVMQNTVKLKGPLSEKELKFLERAVPTTGDSETVWKDYLDELEGLIRERQQLHGFSVSEPTKPGAITDEPSGAFTVAKDPDDPTKLAIVQGGTEQNGRVTGGKIVQRGLDRESAKAAITSLTAQQTPAAPATPAESPSPARETLADVVISPVQTLLPMGVKKLADSPIGRAVGTIWRHKGNIAGELANRAFQSGAPAPVAAPVTSAPAVDIGTGQPSQVAAVPAVDFQGLNVQPTTLPTLEEARAYAAQRGLEPGRFTFRGVEFLLSPDGAVSFAN